MKNITWCLVFGGVLLLAYSPSGNAGGTDINVYPVNEIYQTDYRYQRNDQYAPHWMQRDRSFWRWYGYSVYHHGREYRHLNWARLFDLYLHEQRHEQRHHKYDRHDWNNDRAYRGYERYGYDRHNNGHHRGERRRDNDDRRRRR